MSRTIGLPRLPGILAVLLGVLATGVPAHAQTAVFDAASAIGGAGTWHVVATEIGSTASSQDWQVTVSANPGVASNAFGVGLAFMDGSGKALSLAAGVSGGTSGNNWATYSDGVYSGFKDSVTLADLLANGKNSFSGILRLNTSTKVGSIRAAVLASQSPYIWLGTGKPGPAPTSAPEPQSLVLALAGLLPLGLLSRPWRYPLRRGRSPRQ